MTKKIIGFGTGETNFKLPTPKPDRKPQPYKQPPLPSRKPVFEDEKDDRILEEEIKEIQEQVEEQNKALKFFLNPKRNIVPFLYELQKRTQKNRKINGPI